MNRILLTGTLLGAIFLQSCNDDYLLNNDGGGIPAMPGTLVTFSAGLEPEKSPSRTVYGNRDGNVFPIYWSCPDNNGENGTYDDIYIYSPTGSDDPSSDQIKSRHARYTVKPPIPEHKGMAPVELADGEKGIVVSESGDQIFCAFYPYSAVIDDAKPQSHNDFRYVKVNLPTKQTVYVPSADKNNVYYAECDMNLCYMRAISTYTPEENKPIQLQFTPWTTVLDITVPGPEDGSTCTVTDVIVRTIDNRPNQYPNAYPYNQIISGTFVCNFENDLITPYHTTQSRPNDACSDIIKVNICPEGSNEPGFDLESGKSLNFKVFLAPNTGVYALDIEVKTVGGYSQEDNQHPTDCRTWSKRLAVEYGTEALLEQGKIHPVVLPPIDSKQSGAPDLSRWMSELPDNTKITDLSIPGSYGAFDYASKSTASAQTENFATQFNAGIRAFQFHLQPAQGYTVGIDPIVNGLPSTGLYQFNTAGYYSTFGAALVNLTQLMKTIGTREFCIVEIDLDVFENDNDATLSKSMYGFCNTLAQYLKYLETQGVLPPTPTDQGYTLGDLRGKILLQFKFPGDPKCRPANNADSNFNIINQRWNSCFNNYTATEEQREWAHRPSMISPMANIHRLISPSVTSKFYDWFTYEDAESNPYYESESSIYKTAVPEYTDYNLPASWQQLPIAYGAKRVPMMLTYFTTSSYNLGTITPMTFGNIGGLQYTPKYDSYNDYLEALKVRQEEQSNQDLYYDEAYYFDAKPGSALNYNQPFNEACPRFKGMTDYKEGHLNYSMQGNEDAGLLWMYAYIVWRNQYLRYKSYGVAYDGVINTYIDPLMWYVLYKMYEILHQNPDVHYWLHHHENSRKQATYADRLSAIQSMWNVCEKFKSYTAYADKSMVEAYRSVYGNNLFVSTWLGFCQRVVGSATSGQGVNAETYYTYNQKIVNDWISYVCDTSGDTYKVNSRYAGIPLGAVYLPYVPDRLKTLDETDLTGVYLERCQTGKKVRKIIEMMINHNKSTIN